MNNTKDKYFKAAERFTHSRIYAQKICSQMRKLQTVDRIMGISLIGMLPLFCVSWFRSPISRLTGIPITSELSVWMGLAFELALVAFCVCAMIRYTIILSEDVREDVKGLKKQLRDFKKLFGRRFETLDYPHYYAEEQMLKKIRLMKALQDRKQDTHKHHQKLRKMWDCANALCEVSGYEALFAR